jgi:hypothetical protein
VIDFNQLPGRPERALVRRVTRFLRRWGVLPSCDEHWLAAWTWAKEMRQREWLRRWPQPIEIAARYLLLVTDEMRRMTYLPLEPDDVPSALERQQRRLVAELQDGGKSPAIAGQNPPSAGERP